MRHHADSADDRCAFHASGHKRLAASRDARRTVRRWVDRPPAVPLLIRLLVRSLRQGHSDRNGKLFFAPLRWGCGEAGT